MEFKVCKKCGMRLLIKHFYYINSRKQYHARCKSCCIDAQRAYRKKRKKRDDQYTTTPQTG